VLKNFLLTENTHKKKCHMLHCSQGPTVRLNERRLKFM